MWTGLCFLSLCLSLSLYFVCVCLICDYRCSSSEKSVVSDKHLQSASYTLRPTELGALVIDWTPRLRHSASPIGSRQCDRAVASLPLYHVGILASRDLRITSAVTETQKISRTVKIKVPNLYKNTVNTQRIYYQHTAIEWIISVACVNLRIIIAIAHATGPFLSPFCWNSFQELKFWGTEKRQLSRAVELTRGKRTVSRLSFFFIILNSVTFLSFYQLSAVSQERSDLCTWPLRCAFDV